MRRKQSIAIGLGSNGIHPTRFSITLPRVFDISALAKIEVIHLLVCPFWSSCLDRMTSCFWFWFPNSARMMTKRNPAVALGPLLVAHNSSVHRQLSNWTELKWSRSALVIQTGTLLLDGLSCLLPKCEQATSRHPHWCGFSATLLNSALMEAYPPFCLPLQLSQNSVWTSSNTPSNSDQTPNKANCTLAKLHLLHALPRENLVATAVPEECLRLTIAASSHRDAALRSLSARYHR